MVRTVGILEKKKKQKHTEKNRGISHRFLQRMEQQKTTLSYNYSKNKAAQDILKKKEAKAHREELRDFQSFSTNV